MIKRKNINRKVTYKIGEEVIVNYKQSQKKHMVYSIIYNPKKKVTYISVSATSELYDAITGISLSGESWICKAPQ